MKCPNCGFNSFDYLSECKKCGSHLEVEPIYRVIYEPVIEARKQKSADISKAGAESKAASRALLSEPQIDSAGRDEKNTPGAQAQSLDKTISMHKRPSESDVAESSALLISEKTMSPLSGDVVSFNIAGLGPRAKAFLFDVIVISVITALTLGVGLFIASPDFEDVAWFRDVIVPLYLILFLLCSTYFVFLQGFTGKTLGKMIFGIKVIGDDGRSIGVREAFVRWFGYFVSAIFIFIGFIWAIFDSNGQAWHDKFAGTYVVREFYDEIHR